MPRIEDIRFGTAARAPSLGRARVGHTALTVLLTVLSWGLFVGVSQASAAAASVSVALSPQSITANGTSTTSATATVTDATGNPVPGDALSFSSSDSGETIGPAIDNGDGTYTATITSSTTAQPATITATDSSAIPSVAGSATLNQVPGPATSLSVTLSPSSIKADNSSTTTATASVTDAHGNAVSGDTVAFSSSDGGVQIGSVTANGNGTYTATLTASSTVGTPTITATDTSVAPSVSGVATLTQTAWSTTSVLSVPGAPVTNETATLLAMVTSSSPSVAPSGTVTFTRGGVPITGCSPLTVVPSGQSSTVSCRTAFPASTGNIAAVFTSNTMSLSGSASATAVLQVGQDSTTSTLVSLSPTVKTGTSDTYIAAVTPAHAGAVMPSGSVVFLDGGQPISSCAQQALAISTASSVAVCTIHYGTPGIHTVSVRYSGDGNFTASTSATQNVSVQTPAVPVLGTIAASMQWSFYVAPAGFTKVLQLKVQGAAAGSTILVSCTGEGCPFAKRMRTVSRAVCRTSKTKKAKEKATCSTQRPAALDFATRFGSHRLRAGARITVVIARPNWNGKYYQFVIEARHAPSVRIACLAPGATRPGSGC